MVLLRLGKKTEGGQFPLGPAKCQYVANELRVSLSTVRVHPQRVFEKTGTNRQAELVRLLIGLATTNMPDGLEGAADTQNR